MRPIAILAAATLAACTPPGADNGSNSAADTSIVNEAAPVEADTNSVVVADVKRGEPAPPEAPPPPVPASDTGEDQCGAAKYQALVGKKKSEIPPKPAGATWRVACNSCPVTMDYSPMRLNIFYDTKTEIIESVRCG